MSLPPERDPWLWDSVQLVDVKKRVVTLPPERNMGVARCSMPSAIKLDSKAAKGKNGATVTRQGIKDGSGTIELEIASWAWEATEKAIDGIDPRGPSQGGPFLLVAPNLPKGYGGVQIMEVTRGTAVYSGGRIKISIKYKETTFPQQGTGGRGGAAPKKALTEFERTAIQLSINLLEQRIRTDTLLLENVERADKVKELTDSIASLRQQADALKKQLEAVPPPPSATNTPTGPGQAYSGAKGGNTSKAPDPKSYDATANPAAPTGAP